MSAQTRASRRLHVGCGGSHLPGWVNIDRDALPGVDLVADVTQRLPFENVEAVFGEHFLEHLEVWDALAFLAEVRRVLRPDGVLRLSTPNLDWVWATHYPREGPAESRIRATLHTNRAFYGWGHRFLWNQETLARALAVTGFCDLEWCRYGESRVPVLRGLENHPRSDDAPGLQHVLIVEARPGKIPPQARQEFEAWIRGEFKDHLVFPRQSLPRRLARRLRRGFRALRSS